ncbi:hypothetical protein PN462_21405 [Spirulina sp. CS-785/01]|uniref:hypothetical protein n=1 Tax=Spirulina sp. CS-785/01 TaxID=3021716 RepID=UPI00232FEFEB|nr:hypothetical protein [Spirulina sp. CS-785/01]MDB9315685.1 hypothetical protein [Spirulina sp. CS-785/01]
MGMTPKSGVFLAGCCVSAIAGVGSVFELSYGHPTYGTTATAIILALSVPITVLLFWAAVQDTKANQ